MLRRYPPLRTSELFPEISTHWADRGSPHESQKQKYQYQDRCVFRFKHYRFEFKAYVSLLYEHTCVQKPRGRFHDSKGYSPLLINRS